MLPLLLLLLLGSNCNASHFMGTVMTYYPKNTYMNQSIKVVLRAKMNFHLCTESTTWSCSSLDCGTEIPWQNTVIDKESSGEWCQREEISTRQVPSNTSFQLELSSGSWVINKNGISNWKAVTVVQVRNRSDSNKANSSPQTTILPLLRVPSNCQRDFNLVPFDPDGDDVRCRYGNTSLSECNPCTPPPVLSLSSSCTLSFGPTNSSNEGVYVVQMVMEDFPKQIITLTQTGGSQVVKTNKDSISKIPVQFVVSVDPAVPSCTEGLYLPKFLTPTPVNGAHLYTLVNQPVIINITAEALKSTISELLYSGPSNVNQTTLLPGQYILTWTPSPSEDGENHPICFVVQATYNAMKYHSELRCVVVTVGMAPTPLLVRHRAVVALTVKVSPSSPVSEEDIRNAIIQEVKHELTRRGIASNVTLHLERSDTTAETPGC